MTDRESNVSPPNFSRRLSLAFQIVQFGLFLGLVWKLGLFTPAGLSWEPGFFWLADGVYHQMPLDDPFFPDWLRSASVLRFTYLLTLGSIAICFAFPKRMVRVVATSITLTGLSILCVHQGSYNDATFVTSWWVTVWSLWCSLRLKDSDSATTLRRAAFLSRLIISMVLLGGAVGKWTPEYWSGEVFYDIYFVDRDQWMFNWLRESFEPEKLRSIATWYSRKVIIVETLGGFGLWLMPSRWAATIGAVLFFSIAAFSNFWLFSVTWSFVGLASVGFFDHRTRSKAKA